MLAGSYGSEISPTQASMNAINAWVGKRNNALRTARGVASEPVMNPWINADAEVPAIHEARYDLQLAVDGTMANRYGADNPMGPGMMLAGCLRVLESGLTDYVTTVFGDFDTHNNHFADHLPQLREFGTALAALVDDLQSTEDPSDPTLSLADTTTVLITSEFVRTPQLNPAAGTDHWQSASAIVMGADVVDGATIGATDDSAEADQTFLPDHLCATVLSQLGFEDQANTISEERIDGLFL